MKRISKKEALLELVRGVMLSDAYGDCNSDLHYLANDLGYLLIMLDRCSTIRQRDIDDVVRYFNKNRVK